jgi:hypothetical protein
VLIFAIEQSKHQPIYFFLKVVSFDATFSKPPRIGKIPPHCGKIPTCHKN